jgi:predicted histone-like DNA-binding protein
MSQKYIKTQNKNNQSAAYGKYYAQAVYDSKFIETEELASFIQTQASVKKSDIIAVLQELGEAMKHFFELGQKIHLNGIGIFKVGFSAIGVLKKEDCSAATITTRRVLFQPETERVVVGQEKKPDGSIKQKYVIAKTLVKDVVFEETHDNSMNVEPEEDSSTGSETGGNGSSSSSESVTAPEISGTTPFTESTQVTIQGPQGAEVRYTTDGSEPSAESTLYSEAITLNATTTIKAIAILDGETSAVASKTFTKSGESGGFDLGN